MSSTETGALDSTPEPSQWGLRSLESVKERSVSLMRDERPQSVGRARFPRAVTRGLEFQPSKEAFEKVLRDVKRRMSSGRARDETDDEEIQPFETDRVFMFEDSLKNLVSAKENFNITGVLVKGKTLAEENGEEVAKRFIQINKPCVSELMEKAPSLFA